MAVNFDGSTQYGRVTIGLSQPMTWSYWFKPDSATTSTIIGASNISVSGTSTYYRAYYISTGVLRTMRGNTVFATSGNTATVGAWNHGISIFNTNTSRTVRLNGGTAVTNTTNATGSNPSDFTIGSMITLSAAISEYFPGSIAEVGMWNVALSADEQLMLSKGVSPLLVRPDNLFLYFPLIGRNSPEIELTNSYNMTLTNSPTADVHPRIYMPSSWQELTANAATPPPATRIPRNGVTMLTSPIGIV